jgi:hypothetical protein
VKKTPSLCGLFCPFSGALDLESLDLAACQLKEP